MSCLLAYTIGVVWDGNLQVMWPVWSGCIALDLTRLFDLSCLLAFGSFLDVFGNKVLLNLRFLLIHGRVVSIVFY